MTLTEFKAAFNHWTKEKVPFLFVIDFELKSFKIWKMSDVDPNEVLFDFNGKNRKQSIEISSTPVQFQEYKEKFDLVMERLLYGDSFLTNLTIKTKITSPLALRDLFYVCRAKYKLWMKDSFLVFSPETFVKIKDGNIYSYPMKGTIDSSIPNAEEKILADRKETAEHVTIVDLIRNDLSMVAEDVRVTRFRYVEKVKNLLQVSSEISGKLLPSYYADPAGSFLSLLPAGSVSGAPKSKTLEIIRAAEKQDRGWYTGVCGWSDGVILDSGVMIRYIEQEGTALYYRSGGGITTQSDALSEYQEAQDKIYVPAD